MPVRCAPLTCPACPTTVADLATLACHLVDEAERSEGRHVMWLNRHLTKLRMSPAELQVLLEEELAGDGSSGDRVER